jgi:hypothetical protein
MIKRVCVKCKAIVESGGYDDTWISKPAKNPHQRIESMRQAAIFILRQSDLTLRKLPCKHKWKEVDFKY